MLCSSFCIFGVVAVQEKIVGFGGGDEEDNELWRWCYAFEERMKGWGSQIVEVGI